MAALNGNNGSHSDPLHQKIKSIEEELTTLRRDFHLTLMPVVTSQTEILAELGLYRGLEARVDAVAAQAVERDDKYEERFERLERQIKSTGDEVSRLMTAAHAHAQALGLPPP